MEKYTGYAHTERLRNGNQSRLGAKTRCRVTRTLAGVNKPKGKERRDDASRSTTMIYASGKFYYE